MRNFKERRSKHPLERRPLKISFNTMLLEAFPLG
jgi:hypothetical protein